MPTELPHAATIRTLRQAIGRGLRARELLTDLEGGLTSLALGGSGEGAERVRARLAEHWPELELEGELYAALSRARALLHGAVAEGERAARQVNELLHAQAHDLRREEFAAIREELGQLSDRRTALSTSLVPVANSLASLEPLIRTVHAQIEAIRRDAEAAPAHGRARLTGLLGSVESVLARAGLELSTPRVGADTPLEEAIEALTDFVGTLERSAADLAERRAALEAELGTIERRIQARTG